MATQHLDLDEQEQIANLKHFWKQYGKAITAVVLLIASVYIGWTGWNYWQSAQAQKAAVVFDELNRAVNAGEVDKAARAFADMKDRFGGTTYTAQAALLVSRLHYLKKDTAAAKAPLQWLIDSSAEAAYKDLARLRLASLLVEEKKYDEAARLLTTDISKSFQPLASDRLGDSLMLQNKKAEAKEQYLKAYAGLDASNEYRQLVEVKLASLGVDASAASPAAK